MVKARLAILSALVFLLLGASLGVSPTNAAPTATISDVSVGVGQAEFLVSAQDIPGGSQLDEHSVTVTIDGKPVRANAQPPGAASLDGRAAQPRHRAVMIVMDTSGSMGAADMTAAKDGASGFVRSLPPDVEVGLTTTAPKNRTALAPSADRTATDTAIHALKPGGATALYDALADAVGQLRKAGTGDHRIAVLSDGADTASHATLATVASQLNKAAIPVDVVAFKTAATSATTLQTLARSSGGRLLPSPDAHQMIASFASVAGAFSQAMWVSAALPPGAAGKHAVLAVQVRAGAAKIQVTSWVDLPRSGSTPASGAAVQAAPVTGTVVHGMGSGLLIAALVLCFVAILVFVLAVSAAGRPPTLVEEIALYGTAPEGRGRGGGPGSLLRGLLLISRRAVESGSFEERMARDLERAGLRLRPHEWVLIRCGLGSGMLVAVFLLTGNLLLSLLLGAVGGWAAPRVLLSSLITRRLNAFGDQLPDALQLIASSLRSGFTVSQALDRLARQDLQPLGGEISRAVAQTRLGIGVEEALDGVAERMSCKDLSWVVLAIRIQRDVGGNLADVIETTVDTMRERTHLRRHVRALSAEGRLSAYILIAMPLLVVSALMVLRPGYVRVLFTDPIGVAMLIGAGISMTVGWLWMRSIIKVEA